MTEETKNCCSCNTCACAEGPEKACTCCSCDSCDCGDNCGCESCGD